LQKLKFEATDFDIKKNDIFRDSSAKCQYCPYVSNARHFDNGVKIHIGHQHKCKICRIYIGIAHADHFFIHVAAKLLLSRIGFSKIIFFCKFNFLFESILFF